MPQSPQQELFDATRVCIDNNIPFALFAFPGEEEFHLIAGEVDNATDSLPDTEEFIINHFVPFDGTPLVIRPTLTPARILSEGKRLTGAEEPQVFPARTSTPKTLYRTQLHNVIANLKARGGKVVISRIVAGTTPRHPIEIATEYFADHPGCMRFIYFTGETGLWIGASPELLLDYDGDRSYTTMALAGTRHKNESQEDWDLKNMEEHDFVVDYLHLLLTGIGLTISIDQESDRGFGDITHRCTMIHGEVPAESTDQPDPLSLALQISPTPALCGLPVLDALQTIMTTEAHSRRCYGGFVALRCPDGRFRAYVNLRSGLFKKEDDGQWLTNIYGGSGITHLSSIESEWVETAMKMQSLLRATFPTPPSAL